MYYYELFCGNSCFPLFIVYIMTFFKMCSKRKNKKARTLSVSVPLYIMRGGFTVSEDLKTVYDKLYRYCFFRVRKSPAAEDITQETFLRYFAQNKKITRGEDMAYLYTIAKHLCADFFRKKQNDELTDDFPTEGFSDTTDTKIAVRAAMEKLDDSHGEVISLRYIGGLSVNETAKTLGISRFAVYRLEKAALAEMKKYLKGAF